MWAMGLAVTLVTDVGYIWGIKVDVNSVADSGLRQSLPQV